MQVFDQASQKLVGLLFPIIGVGLLLGAAVETSFTYRFTKTALRAEGEVVKLNAGGAHPVIRFIPVGEKAVEFSGDGFINYAVGDKVTVLYLKDPQSPSGFQYNIDTPGALWFAPLGLTWLGVGFIVGGFYVKYMYKPQQ